MIASGEVYAATLLFYAQNALSARNNLPGAQGAYNEQSKRFPGQGAAKAGQQPPLPELLAKGPNLVL